MSKNLLITAFLSLAFLCQVASAQNKARQVYSMDQDWSFYLGDEPEAYKTNFSDNSWRTLDVPHDWSIEIPLDADAPARGSGGFAVTGIGWYRKTFTMPALKTDQQVRIEFDGVHMRSEVWINGQSLGKRPSGYVSFGYDLTPYLTKGENTIAVKVDNSLQPNSRWYTGSGIYRHVRLVISNPLHIKKWGVYATTPEVSEEKAIVNVKTAVVNAASQDQNGSIMATITNAEGAEVARSQAWFKVGKGAETEVQQEIKVTNPNLWDLESPYMYSLNTIVLDANGKQVDELTTPIGIREIVYDANKGFLLNGKNVKMKGVNLHHDGGPVGAAVPAQVWARRFQILKDGGCNAIRTAHNPMAPEFYDLCDQMGILVMNEALDEWQIGKVDQGINKFFDEWYERDVTDFIHRDRNHPSVVMWSAGNEIREQPKEEGYKVLEQLVEIFHREDPTRPVTAGCDNIAADGGSTTLEFLEGMDIVGYNYVDRWRERTELMYSIDHHAHPDWLMVSTESGGLGGNRGSYFMGSDPDVVNPRYNTNMIPIEQRWKFTTMYDYVIGDFMWTGIDYYGETFRYPSRGASSGIIDNCGFPKDGYYFFQSHWDKDGEAMIHLFPHWNWEGREGQIMPVICYSNCEAIELFVNGKSYGEKRMEFPRQGMTERWAHYDKPQVNPTTGDLHVSWDVAYEPGTIKAVGKRNGEIVVEQELFTSGAPAKIRLIVDRSTITNSPDDVAHCTVEILDANGHIVPTADNMIKFEIKGDAEIIGVENGNMGDVSMVKTNERKAHNGLCLAIIQSEKAGKIKVKATSAGLESAAVDIEIEKVELMPSL
ncbi:MAG TPA: glycoside hydrolase family 2 TIM barrel-domain containing protein [Draconibacterium sp.]|nr:glycoside hydrolase family 2 TIM barrel-domain containing protein [Draconibacterium sp.]